MALSRNPTAPLGRRHWWLAAAGAFAILLPAVVYGPWLPLLDLLAFVGLDNGPAAAAFGPLQYTAFQFTYIGHYALSRVLLSLGISPALQIVVFYLLHGLVFFWVVWRIVTWFIPERWLAGVILALAVGGFWDGLLLWGGPLPYSLAQSCVALVVVATLAEADAVTRPNALFVPLLTLASVVFHPFAAVFAGMLMVIRLVFVPARRGQTVALLVALGVLALVIRHESPEALGRGALWDLLGNPFTHVGRRLSDLLTWNARTTADLFGSAPPLLTGYFWLLGLVQQGAFLLAPIVVVVAKDQPRLRLLAAWTLAGAALYFLAGDATQLVAQWPARILAMHRASAFAFAAVALVFLLRQSRPAVVAKVATWRGPAWTAPVAIAIGIICAQAPILRLGENIRRNLTAVRDGMVQSQLANCFVMVADIRGIEPYYLRAVPFLLVSDPAIAAKNITIFTEWNVQARHPTRLVESWFDLGRQAYEAKFTADQKGTLAVQFAALPRGQLPVPTGLYQGAGESKPSIAQRELDLGNQLVGLGCVRDAAKHYEAALRLEPTLADARNNLGVALWKDDRPNEAVEQFVKTLEAVPRATETRCNLGDLLASLGRASDARAQYEAALQVNPQHPRALAGLQRLAASAPGGSKP